MAKGFKQFILGFIIVGVFTLSLVTFGNNFITLNNENSGEANQTLLSDPILNKTFGDLVSDSSSQQSTAEGLSSILESDEPTIGTESILLTSISSVWKGLKTMAMGSYRIVTNLIFETLFGASANSPFSILIGVLSAIVVTIIALYAWKVVRTGDPD